VRLRRRAAGLAPASAQIRVHLASALNKAGDKAGARKELEQVLAQSNNSPEHEEARALLKQM